MCIHGAPGGEQRIPVQDPETRTSLVSSEGCEETRLGVKSEGSEIGRLCVRPHRCFERTHRSLEVHGKINFEGATDSGGALSEHNHQKSRACLLSH